MRANSPMPLKREVVKLMVLYCLQGFVSSPLGAQEGPGPSPPPAESVLLQHWNAVQKTPVQYVLDTFKSGKRWVVLGEYHRLRHDVQLVLDLIPALHEQTETRCLALEFITASGTAKANRLVTHRTFNRDRALAFFMREAPSWNYEEYFMILETIWRSNRDRAARKGPFTLVGLTPKVDWEIINFGKTTASARERRKLDRYDKFMANSLETRVLSPGRPALIYVGSAHATAKYKGYSISSGQTILRMGNLVYREPYKAKMWFIALHAPLYDPEAKRALLPFRGTLDRLMKQHGQDLGFDVVNSPFASLRQDSHAQSSQGTASFGECFDGYVMFKAPLGGYATVTCILDWVRSPSQYRWYRRHVAHKEAAEELAKVPYPEIRGKLAADCLQDAESIGRAFRCLQAENDAAATHLPQAGD